MAEFASAASQNTDSKGTYLENTIETVAKNSNNNFKSARTATLSLSNEIGSFVAPTKISKQTKTQSDITSIVYAKKTHIDRKK